MKMHLILGIALLSCSFAVDAETRKSITRTNLGGAFAPGDIIFEDEFLTFNHSIWDYEANMNGGGNNEFQVYDRDEVNSFVKDGMLHNKPSLTLDKLDGNFETLYNGYHWVTCCTDPPRGNACDRQANYPYILQPAYSARLRTKGAFSFTYGKVEVRAKIPKGDWLWPAIWMMPEKSVYGGWPASGEIDIMESRGNINLANKDGVQIGSEQVGSTMHFGPKWPFNGYFAAHNVTNSPRGEGFAEDFHVYKIEWTDTKLDFYVDDLLVTSVNPPAGGFFELGQFPDTEDNIWANGTNPLMAPFDEDFHIILNVAVGGNFFPAESTPSRPWGTDAAFNDFFQARDEWYPTWNGDDGAMIVDYVRVFAV